MEELEFKLSDLINEIQTIDPECFNKKLLWDYRSVISINKIKYVMDGLSSQTATPIALTYLQQNINLETTEYKLEKANINPGFIQTTFDQRRIYEDRTPFNISLGITIPIVNPDKEIWLENN